MLKLDVRFQIKTAVCRERTLITSVQFLTRGMFEFHVFLEVVGATGGERALGALE